MPWLFIAPITLLHLIVAVGPSISGMYYALTDWSGIGKADFIGLENFRELFFEDSNFRLALRHNVMWLAFFLTVPFMALAVACYWRSAPPFLFPMCCPVLWSLRSGNPRLGALLEKWGIHGFAHPYLGDKRPGCDCDGRQLALVGIPADSLPDRDAEHLRTCMMRRKIDGANRWQEFLNVTLPGMMTAVIPGL